MSSGVDTRLLVQRTACMMVSLQYGADPKHDTLVCQGNRKGSEQLGVACGRLEYKLACACKVKLCMSDGEATD